MTTIQDTLSKLEEMRLAAMAEAARELASGLCHRGKAHLFQLAECVLDRGQWSPSFLS